MKLLRIRIGDNELTEYENSKFILCSAQHVSEEDKGARLFDYICKLLD